MITIQPIRKALVPCDSQTAAALSSPNYDEFQNDQEVFNFIKKNPASILAVKMPHCAVETMSDLLKEGSTAALALAKDNMEALKQRKNMRVLSDFLYIYEITAPSRPNSPQIGLGCFGKTSEILTDKTPDGTIIRNEGIRESKANGRADLIKATNSFIGVVNNAVEDSTGAILSALQNYATSKKPDYELRDERNNYHKVWLLTEKQQQDSFVRLFAGEPNAYVADGNHRSAAAAMLGYDNFLTVFFPAKTMGIHPYNRLLCTPTLPPSELLSGLSPSFEVTELGSLPGGFQPNKTHEIGLYFDQTWLKLEPKPGTYEPTNAVAAIDSDIVQNQIFAKLFGIEDARDNRLTFVGSNKDTQYLVDQVDSGSYQYAFTLPPVTMTEFIEVCRQRRMMPPKSTWFEPKIRSGLVIALL